MSPESEQKDQEVRRHWEDAAVDLIDEEGLKRTIRDHYLQDAIEEIMLSYLRSSQTLLDVGCGDGASTVAFASKTQAAVVAVDYIEAFVSQTRTKLTTAGIADVTAIQGDARQLKDLLAGVKQVDVATSIRCLINLTSEAEQLSTAEAIVNHLKPGGLYLCSEGWSESWAALAAMRARCGLGEMHLVHHNLLISREELVRRLSPDAELVGYHSLGFYVFLSRVFHPMVVSPDPPKHMSKINATAKRLISLGVAPADFDELGYPGVCVFRKT